jgi:hypothetical protein
MYEYKTLDDKEACVGIFLDLLKASDLLSHNILLQKLHSHGIRRNAHQWFVTYVKKQKAAGINSLSQYNS